MARIRRKSLYAALFYFLVLVPGTPRALLAGIFSGPGKQKVENVLRSPELAHTNVGIKVVNLSTGKTVFEKNGNKLFIPASTVKLLTAYGALKVLTPEYAFPTEFATDAFAGSTTVHHLYIKGYGDPSATLADVNAQAWALSEKIRLVSGDIVVDTSYFDGLRFGRGWMWDEGIAEWNAPVSPYAVNGNCVDILVRPGKTPGYPVTARSIPRTSYAVVVASAITSDRDEIAIRREEFASGDRFIISGSMSADARETRWKCTVSRPGLYAGTLFKELLEQYGVEVNGSIYEAEVSSSALCIERYASRNLADILRSFLKDSDNLTGECVLKTLGASSQGPPGDAVKGIAAIKGILSSLGVKEGSYELADGSGLSTYNLLSPDIVLKVLCAAYRDFSYFPEFIDALSIAGVDGTLKDRMKGTSLARYVRAKTGTMSGVSCISGYLQTRKGNMLAVSIMMNGYTGPSKPFKTAQDEILRVLWEYY